MKTPEEKAAALIAQALHLLVEAAMPQAPPFDGLIPLPKAERFVGYSPKAMRRKIESGVWAEGREFQRRTRPGSKVPRIWIDVRGVAEWSRLNGGRM